MAGINIYNDPLLNGSTFLQTPEMQKAQQEYLMKLEALKQSQQQIQQGSQTPIWDKIDEEISTLTEMQKSSLFGTEEFKQVSSEVQAFIQDMFLAMMKPKVENSEAGKQLLQKQYDVVKKVKKSVVENSNKEMEQFRKWQEYATSHPNATYQEFLNVYK